MFVDSQDVEQDIVLRTQSKVFTDIRHIPAQFKYIDVRSPATWWKETWSTADIWNGKQHS